MPRGRLPGGAAVRQIGTVTDAMGRAVTISADCDAVVLTRHDAAAALILGPGERDVFTRLYFEAESAAGAWAAEHSQANGITRPDL